MSMLLAIPRALILAGYDMIGIFLGIYVWILVIGMILSWLIVLGAANRNNRVVGLMMDFYRRVTDPFLVPMRNALPPVRGFDLTPLVLLLIILLIERFLLGWLGITLLQALAFMQMEPDMTGDLAQPVRALMMLLGIYIWIIIIGIFLNWLIAFGIVDAYNKFVCKVLRFVDIVTNPFLKRIRKKLKPVGGVDLSLLALIFIVIFIQQFLLHLVI